MQTVLQRKVQSLGSARCATTSRRTSVRVQAVAENVAEAREWIGNWKNKQAGRNAAWFPGTRAPEHLDGSLVGDFGFDPLGLGVDAGKLAWYQQAELVHCRFAMLGVAGVLFPEVLKSAGLGGPAAQVPWFDAGKFEYFASADALFGVQMLLFAWVELRRLQDIRKPGSVNQDPIFSNNKLPDSNEVGYPGGIFDPLGYAKGTADKNNLKLKEIKNGRLAMLAFAGFAVQAFATGTTPLQGLSAHLADPWSTTVWQNSQHLSAWRLQ
jgi:light-harvesting complex I chlorophyll a/b binding protein 2/light-harvesting complex I chlorophyll a/b binding protein 4